MQNTEQIVFKRAAKRHSHQQHGGAWKVAFADFMIALMALFLVLWLLQVVDEKERTAIVAYFNNSSVFDEGAGNPFDTDNSPSPIDFGGDAADMSAQQAAMKMKSIYDGNGNGPESDALIPGSFETQEQLAILASVVEKTAKQISAQGNIAIDITPQGLRVTLQDDFKQNMFHRGNANLTPFFEDVLLTIAPIFKQISNSIIISGHTDATQFKNRFSRQTNWELSSSRANVARQTLISGGMPSERVLQVAGMAERALLNKQDPKASENRRIELFVLTTTAANVVDALFGKGAPENIIKAQEDTRLKNPVLRSDYINHSITQPKEIQPVVSNL